MFRQLIGRDANDALKFMMLVVTKTDQLDEDFEPWNNENIPLLSEHINGKFGYGVFGTSVKDPLTFGKVKKKILEIIKEKKKNYSELTIFPHQM